MTRFWFDTEFMEDGERIELLSIGIVSEWVVENVIPHLDGPVMSRQLIAAQIVEFAKAGEGKPEFWAYYGDYDWVVLCQLYGTMMDLPRGWPMFAMDVKQLCVSLGDPRLPGQTGAEHNALEDARWTRDAWRWLVSL